MGFDAQRIIVAAPGDPEGVARARATVRAAFAVGRTPNVVDVGGAYRPVSDEQVVTLPDAATALGLTAELRLAAATLGPAQLVFYAGVAGASLALSRGSSEVLVAAAGVVLLGPPPSVPDEDTARMVVVPASDSDWAARHAFDEPAHIGRSAQTGMLVVEESPRAPLFARALYVVNGHEVDRLRALAADWRTASGALDVVVASTDARIETRTAALLTARRAVGATSFDVDHRLLVDGDPVFAIDLTGLDPTEPWLLDPAAGRPQLALSGHPALVRLVAAEAERRSSDRSHDSVGQTASRASLAPVLLSEARRAEPGAVLPDALGLGTGPGVEDWALELVPERDPMPCARYLAAVRLARPELAFLYRDVPGSDSAGLADWALRHGVNELVDGGLLRRAAEKTLAAQTVVDVPRPRDRQAGVNLVGYLAGELGLGESARLVGEALHAAGVQTSTHDITSDIGSRKKASYRRSTPQVLNTNVVCVNGSDVPHVAARMSGLFKGSFTVGMWYWELEEFPAAHRVGLAHVDEVWAATDFVRDAIARHAGDTPVRTVMPPLPQAGPDPGKVPDRFGIQGDRPWFLFTFDFLSVAERKNPLGLVEAFTRAFGEVPEDQRPLLVIKSINSARHPGPAERLRLQVVGRSDVLLIDEYLDHAERHVLVSNCTAFVSLHRAEGLGLTIAEAMAWGKPVITTGYGGVMQFCTPDNSFLVDWVEGHVGPNTAPYEEGLVWADPDLDHAAALMRHVMADPEHAAQIGARAAEDIRRLHNPEVAGEAMKLALDDGRARWAARRAERRALKREAANPPEGSPSASTTPRRSARRVLGGLLGKAQP